METSEQILVIFLSVALAFFLVLSIFALVKIIQLVNALKRIVDKAESLADKANSLGDIFRKTAAPVAIGRLFAHLANSVFSKQKVNRRRDYDD